MSLFIVEFFFSSKSGHSAGTARFRTCRVARCRTADVFSLRFSNRKIMPCPTSSPENPKQITFPSVRLARKSHVREPRDTYTNNIARFSRLTADECENINAFSVSERNGFRKNARATLNAVRVYSKRFSRFPVVFRNYRKTKKAHRNTCTVLVVIIIAFFFFSIDFLSRIRKKETNGKNTTKKKSLKSSRPS